MNVQENKIMLVAGLGNPGREYAETRHNAGFDVIDILRAGLPGEYVESHICDSRCFDGKFRGNKLCLVMPQTFMNLSGRAVAGLARKRGIAPAEILVVSDDLDLPVGKLRIRRGGSAGGHHGVESVIAELGSADFVRLRVGVGRSSRPGDTVDHVLGKVSGADQPLYTESLRAAAQAVLAILSAGVQTAMNKFNAWRPTESDAAENGNNSGSQAANQVRAVQSGELK